MRQYRVWTINYNYNNVSVMTTWLSRSHCKRFIIGRWSKWPPFAFISTCKSEESFRKTYRVG